MVFESVVAGLLSKHLGAYVSGLDKENLKLAVGSGNIELCNLSLKAEALQDLDLPIVVKKGVLGSLTVKIPWRSLGSKSTVVVINDLYILVHPRRDVANEDWTYQLHRRKRQALALNELFSSSSLEDEEQADKGKASGSPSWTERMVNKVVNNILVTINNIHIRYEDSVPPSGKSISFGITLDALRVESADGNWVPRFLDTIDDVVMRKLATLSHLCVYFNPDDAALTYSSNTDFVTTMKALIHSKSRPVDHAFVLRPLSGQLRATVNKSDEPDMDNPKIKVEAEFPNVSLWLSDEQFRDVLSVSESIGDEKRSLKYRELKPEGRPTDGPEAARKWWKYVIGAVKQDRQENRKVWSWEHLKAHTRDRHAYILLWYKYLTEAASDMGKLTEVDQGQLQALEFRLTYDAIVQYRALATMLARQKIKEAKEQAARKQASRSVLGRMWGTTKAQVDKAESVRLNVDVIHELYRQQVAHEEAAGASTLPPSYVKTRLSFLVKRGIFTLATHADKAPLTVLQFSTLLLNAAIMPKAMCFNAGLRSMTVVDYTTTGQMLNVVEASQRAKDLLTIQLELNPVDGRADTAVKLDLQPLDIVFSKKQLDRITDFFSQPQSAVLQDISQYADATFSSIQESARAHLVESMTEAKTLELDICVRAPNVVVPASFEDADCPRLVAILGEIRFRSNLDERRRAIQAFQDKSSTSLAYLYDTYEVSLTRMQALLAHTEDWRKELVQRKRVHMVDELDLSLRVDVCTANVSTIPKIKVSGALTKPLRVYVAMSKVLDFMSVLDSLASPIDGSVPVIDTVGDEEPEAEEGTGWLGGLVGTKDEKAESPTKGKRDADTGEESNPIQLQLRFEVPDVTAILYRREEVTFEPIDLITISFVGLHVSFAQRAESMEAQAGLHSVHVVDSIQQWGPDCAALVSSLDQGGSEADDMLIHVTWENVAKTSSLYQGMDHRVSLKFATLAVMLNRETIIHMLNFFDELSAGMAARAAAQPLMEGAEVQTPSTEAVQVKDVADTSKLLHLEAEMTSFKVCLNKSGHHFVMLDIGSSSTVVVVGNNGSLEIDGHMGQLCVKDGSGTTYTRIAHTATAAKTATYGFYQYVKDAHDYPGYDSKVFLRMESIKMFFINRFVDELVQYFDEMDEMKSYVSQSASSAAAAAQEAGSAAKMMFDVIVESPIVIIPKNSASDEIVITSLGRLSLKSSFDGVGDECLTSMILGIEGMNMKTGIRGHAEDDGYVITDTHLNLCIVQPVNKGTHAVPDMAINATLSQMMLHLSDAQLELFWGILSGNMCEAAPVSVEVMERRAQRQELLVSSDDEEDEAQPVDEGDVYTSMSIHFQWEQLGLSLASSSEGGLSELTAFHINDMDFGMQMYSDSSMALEVDMHTVEWIDARPEADTQFKQLLTRRCGDEGLIRVRFEASREQFQTIRVDIADSRIYVMPEAFVGMYLMLMPQLDKMSTALGAWNEFKESRMSDADRLRVEAEKKGITDAAVGGMLLEVNLNNPELAVPEVASDASTRALIIHSNIGLRMVSDAAGVADMELNVKGWRMYKCRLGNDDLAVNIIDPFDVHLGMQVIPGHRTAYEATLSPLDVTMSYNDYLLFMGVYKAWGPSLDKFSSGNDASAEEGSDEGEASDDAIADKGKGEADAEGDATVEPEAQSFTVNIPSFRGRIIDDIYGQMDPILQVVLVETHAQVSGWSTRMQAVFGSSVRVDYYNMKNQSWEPLLRGLEVPFKGASEDMARAREKPWDILASLNTDSDTGVMGVKIMSSKSLTFIVTASMIQTLLQLKESWSPRLVRLRQAWVVGGGFNEVTESGYAVDTLSARSTFVPYIVSNQTGTQISFWQEGDEDVVVLPPEAGVNEAPLSESRFSVSRSGALEKRSGRPITFLLSDYVSQKVTKEATFEDLTVDRVGAFCLPFHAETVVYDVHQRKGSKVLALRSNFLVVNKTLQPLYPSWNPKVPIAPGERTAVPLRWMEYGKPIGCTPDPAKWSMSESDPPVERSTSGAAYWLRCSGDGPTTYLYSGLLVPFQDMHAVNSYHYEFHIEAPILVKNLTQQTLDLSWHEYTGSGKKFALQEAELDSVSLNRTEEYGVHHLREDMNVAMRVVMAGFDPAVIPVFGECVSTSLELVAANKVIKMEVNYVTQGNHRTLNLHFKYLVDNRLPMPVRLKGERGKQKYDDPVLMGFFAQGQHRDFERSIPWGDRSLQVSMPDSGWSTTILLAKHGGSGSIELECGKGRQKPVWEVGVETFMAPRDYWRSKVVKLLPRYMVVNKSGRVLRYCQRGHAADECFTLQPDTQAPLRWTTGRSPRMLCFSFDEDGWGWSGGYTIQPLDLSELKLKNPEGRYVRLQMHTTTSGAQTAIIIQPSNPEFPSYMIRNYTNETLVVSQAHLDVDSPEVIPPMTESPFTWLEPSAPKREIIVGVAGTRVRRPQRYKLDAVKGLKPIRIHRQEGDVRLIPSVVLDGAVRVLQVLSEEQADGDWSTDDETTDDEDGDRDYERDVIPNEVKMTVTLEMRGVDVVLLDEKPQEIMSLSLSDIRVAWADGTLEQHLEASVGALQIDNQLFNTPYSIVWYPVIPRGSQLPFFHMAMNKSKEYESISFFNGLHVTMQEVDVRVDEAFLTHMVDWITTITDSMAKTEAVFDSDTDYVSMDFSQSDLMYFRMLHVGPIKMSLSYSSCGWAAKNLEASALDNILAFAGHLTDLDMAPLKLGSFFRENVFQSQGDLIAMLTEHYVNNAIKRFYLLLGSASFLGNPVSLVSNVGEGVRDLFYEPAQAIKVGPASFGRGVVRGTSSLFKKTFAGILGTTGALTNTAGNLVAAMSFDKEYRHKRDRERKRQARHAGEGLLMGVKDFGKGIFKGVTGIIVDPIKGAKRGGAKGFAKGLLTGVAGVVTKPVAGTLDMATRFQQGLKNTTTYFDHQSRARVRWPRAQFASTIIKDYNGYSAEGQALLFQLEDGDYRHEYYAFHFPSLDFLAVSKRLLLVSNKYLYELQGDDPSRAKSVRRLMLKDVEQVALVSDSGATGGGCGVLVKLGEGKKPLWFDLPAADAAYVAYNVSRLHLAAKAVAESGRQHQGWIGIVAQQRRRIAMVQSEAVESPQPE